MASDQSDNQWPLWEVFVAPGNAAPHEHAGSVHAVDAEHGEHAGRRRVVLRSGERQGLPASAVL